VVSNFDCIYNKRSAFNGAFFMTINMSMPSINNFLAGFSDGLPGMKDYASRISIICRRQLQTDAQAEVYVPRGINVDDTKFTRSINNP
jgi:hypothetical protein